MRHKADSLPGSLAMVILRTLSLRDLRGYGIVQLIQQSSASDSLVEEGSVYPALQRLELGGWIEGVWGVTSDHRRARIYKITAAGRRQVEARTWRTHNSRIEDAPAAERKSATSCLLLGCVVTGAAFGLEPAHDAPSGGIPVDVCMQPTQELLISTSQAKSLTSTIFSPIGVELTWHTGFSDCNRGAGAAFQIRWAERAPSTSPAGTLAAARPFGSSETSITLYEIPLQRFLRQYPNAPEVVLAYVLVHELAHVMQGLDRHSASGILKANWSYGEYCQMLSRTLTFTVEDVDLIRAGLEATQHTAESGKRGATAEHVASDPAMRSSAHLGTGAKSPDDL